MFQSILQSAIRPFARSMILPVEKLAVLPVINLIDARSLHLTSNVERDLKIGKEKVRVKPIKSTVAVGEASVHVSDTANPHQLFPDATTANSLFNHIPYNKLHIINVKVTLNNTILSVTDYRGMGMLLESGGTVGYKNAKKGTNVAAQQAAHEIATKALQQGIQMVRVRIQGLGPGRAGALKGIQMSGLNVVSLTDDTRVSWNPQRPRKQRRI